MITDKYISTAEMKEISSLCKALDEVFNVSLKNELTSVDESFNASYPVYDCNGECLGHIGLTKDGFGLYLDDGVE